MSDSTPDEAATPPVDAPEPPRRRAGRPTKYRASYCQRVIELGGKGQSRAQMAAALGVSRRVINLWETVHEEFAEALELAGDLCLAWWETKAQDNLTTSSWQGGTWSRSMAARFPADYREVVRREHTGVENAPPIRTEESVAVSLAAGEAYLAMLHGPAPAPAPAPAPEAPA